MQENAHVKSERARLADEWDRGIHDGYETNPNPLPAFFSKPYKEMTAYERAYIFGREVKIAELEESEDA